MLSVFRRSNPANNKKRQRILSPKPWLEMLEDRRLLSCSATQFNVSSRSAWSDTGIDVVAGQTLSISATGQVSINTPNSTTESSR